MLVAGDSAAYIEVEVQGGLMCVYHAALLNEETIHAFIKCKTKAYCILGALLYKQGADSVRIGQYVLKWLQFGNYARG